MNLDLRRGDSFSLLQELEELELLMIAIVNLCGNMIYLLIYMA